MSVRHACTIAAFACLPVFLSTLAGCAARSNLTYDDTVTSIRSMCQSHDVTGRDEIHTDRPVFGIEEEGRPNGNEWEITFAEGNPRWKQDVVAQKRTQISVVRQSGDEAGYRVRCYDAGLKIDTRNDDREEYWSTRIEECLQR